MLQGENLPSGDFRVLHSQLQSSKNIDFVKTIYVLKIKIPLQFKVVLAFSFAVIVSLSFAFVHDA